MLKVSLFTLGTIALIWLALKSIRVEDRDENILPGWNSKERNRMMLRAQSDYNEMIGI